jgi:hypothetical protein
MPFGMETIRERLTHLENVLGPVVENKNQSVNDRFVYAVALAERAAGQYVDLAAEVSRKIQVLEEKIAVLKRAVTTVPTGDGTSKPKLLEPKPFGGVRSSMGGFRDGSKKMRPWSSKFSTRHHYLQH